ncbi:MAG: outer membrane protein assembly factor BamD [Planctomycetota bacterium]
MIKAFLRCRLALVIVAFSYGLPCALAGGTWVPDMGEVDLEERPRDEAEARFKHAVALLASGESKSAARQLRGLLEEHPEAPWANRARYMLAVAQYNLERYEAAFNTLNSYQKDESEDKAIQQVENLQYKAAEARTEQNLNKGIELLDQLAERSGDPELAAQAQKSKADALREDGQYLKASDEYLALIDTFPRSELVAECWYRIGMCHLELARWIGRGTEHLKEAQTRLKDFLYNFPDTQFAPEAREALQDAQRLHAEKYARIARYYIGPADRPAAALPYLRHVRRTVPDKQLGQWAEKQIRKIHRDRESPPRGHLKPIKLSQ